MDRVIVNEKDVLSLYSREFTLDYLEPLTDLGLVPLTLETLIEGKGNGLHHLAIWTHLSGSFKKPNYVPDISGNPDMLQYLEKNYFSKLDQKFRPSSSGIYLTQNAGLIGRLVACMLGFRFVYAKKKITKAETGRKIPKYWQEIISVPSHDSKARVVKGRESLLKDIARAIFYDRMKIRGFNPFLPLGHHPTRELAEEYGQQIINTLNESIPHNQHFPLYDHQLQFVETLGRHRVTLVIEPNQTMEFVSRGIISIKPNY